jgi:UDP-glucose 4-epimerase
VKFAFSGGVDGGRGWVGDVKTMLLDTGRIKALGWKPRLDSKGAVQQLVRVMRSERAR